MDDTSPAVAITVLNYNGAQITLNCVDSVLKIDYPNFRVIVVDNGSTDDSVARFKEAFTDPRIELLVNDRNEGYAGGNNRGIERSLAAGAEYVLVLNNDTIVEPGCLAPLVGAMERDRRIGIAACTIIEVNSAVARNRGYRLSLFTGATATCSQEREGDAPAEVDYVCGAAILLRVATIKEIDAFDPKFFLTWEDADLCYRARAAGYRVCFVPGPGVQHLHSETINRMRPWGAYYGTRNKAWFIRRHGKLMHRVFFGVFSFCYHYPRVVLGRLYRREFELLPSILKGIVVGHWGHGVRTS